MAKLKVLNEKEILNVSSESTILKVLLDNKIYINNPCNGKGVCGKCKIKILSGNVSNITETEKSFLSSDEQSNNIRLACLTHIYSDTEIEIIDKEKEVSVLTDSYIRDFVKDDLSKGFGVAIDIGTTTVVAELINLLNGETLSNSSMVNAQKQYGLDVLTRITYENENGEVGIKNLKDVLVESINGLISDITKKSNVNVNDIKKVAVAANCTMMHTFLGVDARSIGVYPYKPNFIESKVMSAKSIGLNTSDDCVLICLPHVSAFIGADIVSGIYVCDIMNLKGNVLFIDIGTNAEIVLKANDRLVSCSCAAGPALEGMNISKGMRAEAGAIEDVVIDGDRVNIKTIGDKKPEGLCGSGILATIKELIKNKIIQKSGAFVKTIDLDENDFRKKRIRITEKKKEFIISENPEISITQSDIRQVQLAKGAILSGFTALLNKCNIDMNELDEILVAGQFGAHLPAESIVGIGILPKEVKNKIRYVGNVSKTGSYMTLLSKKALSELKDLSKKVEYLELADTKDYEKIFVKSMEFPYE